MILRPGVRTHTRQRREDPVGAVVDLAVATHEQRQHCRRSRLGEQMVVEYQRKTDVRRPLDRPVVPHDRRGNAEIVRLIGELPMEIERQHHPCRRVGDRVMREIDERPKAERARVLEMAIGEQQRIGHAVVGMGGPAEEQRGHRRAVFAAGVVEERQHQIRAARVVAVTIKERQHADAVLVLVMAEVDRPRCTVNESSCAGSLR